MERALPTDAFTPGRNIGIKFNNTALDERISYAGGFFWNTGSINDIQNPQDQISQANGYNITARVSYPNMNVIIEQHKVRSGPGSSPFKVTFLASILLVGYQIIITRFPSRRDVALARQVSELTNHRVRFEVNLEPVDGHDIFYHLIYGFSFTYSNYISAQPLACEAASLIIKKPCHFGVVSHKLLWQLNR